VSGTRDAILQVDANGDPYVKVGGLKVYLASMPECEQAGLAVCGAVSFFDDDVWTTCADCGHRICHRPDVPAAPLKICPGCLVKRLRAVAKK